jgi:hypothetical protein
VPSAGVTTIRSPRRSPQLERRARDPDVAGCDGGIGLDGQCGVADRGAHRLDVVGVHAHHRRARIFCQPTPHDRREQLAAIAVTRPRGHDRGRGICDQLGRRCRYRTPCSLELRDQAGEPGPQCGGLVQPGFAPAFAGLGTDRVDVDGHRGRRDRLDLG